MENPFKNQVLKLRRTGKLTQILVKYGFQDLLGSQSKRPPMGEESLSPNDPTVYERIRLAIEELGPTFVKFGQTLSSREDLLPALLIVELKKLQDRVPPQEIDIVPYIEEQLGINASESFREIETEPIASASIAQVYKAVLADGTPVILKIKRPNIRTTINSDLLILRDIVQFLSDYSLTIRQINLKYILATFQKTLVEELSFVHEAQNIVQFEQNFRGVDKIHCIHTYEELCNDDVLCVSWIDGVKITDKDGLMTYDVNFEHIVDSGLELFLTQVLEHGFFHADPHPGNILVTPDGKLSFLDFGAMGRMLLSDQVVLEDFIIAFINKDADSLLYIIKKMAIYIQIENEKNIKREILELFEMASTNTLENIDIKAFFSKFSNILYQNNIIMPEHIYLLVRGVVLMEGIGRELMPGLNIIEKIKPYIEQVIRKRLSFENLKKESQRKLMDSFELLSHAPYTLKNIAQRLEQGDLTVKVDNSDLQHLQRQYRKNQSTNRSLALGCLFFVSGCLVISVEQYRILGIPILSWIFFVIGISFLILAKLRSLRID
ncbi:ABC1 kinase family protein [Sphingobacterium corticibacterium]|uniref:AarF/ABC1/UbiB kinase family protein n=1 Tax=Sphingobacterium corticibacterium TaxID=2484746 RepID=A0A4Q6XR61_9SPHI|nr:AarF/UbiB family protein [Sphingobacterium corticibacterium]RZF62235.1 AarF/ABC1/UbiB kinase family protein [Sphingobacterium corticibacterium]